MDLKDIAAVAGKGGLYKIIKPTRTGVVLETIDQNRTKVIANSNDRVSLLKEISVYTSGEETSLPLEKVFAGIYKTYGNTLNVDSKSSPQDLTRFIEEVVPAYDREKVYLSDVKKIAVWYNTLVNHYPERFTQEPNTTITEAVLETATDTPADDTEKSEAAENKPKS